MLKSCDASQRLPRRAGTPRENATASTPSPKIDKSSRGANFINYPPITHAGLALQDPGYMLAWPHHILPCSAFHLMSTPSSRPVRELGMMLAVEPQPSELLLDLLLGLGVNATVGWRANWNSLWTRVFGASRTTVALGLARTSATLRQYRPRATPNLLLFFPFPLVFPANEP